MFGSRAIYHDGWKAVTDHVANQFDERSHLVGSLDFDTDRWSLFHLAEDFSESRDLADEHPERVRRLEELWWAEAGRNQVLPLFEFPASMAHMHPGEFPPPKARHLRARRWADPGEPAPGADGRLRADGARRGARRRWPRGSSPPSATGTAAGRRTSSTAGWSPRSRCSTGPPGWPLPTPVPAGEHVLSVRYEPGAEPRLVLAVDGVDVAAAPLPGLLFFPNLGSSGAGMLVGRDRGIAVSARLPAAVRLHRHPRRGSSCERAARARDRTRAPS